jgi:hypothetical protein
MPAAGHVLEPRPTNAVEDDDENENDVPRIPPPPKGTLHGKLDCTQSGANNGTLCLLT